MEVTALQSLLLWSCSKKLVDQVNNVWGGGGTTKYLHNNKNKMQLLTFI